MLKLKVPRDVIFKMVIKLLLLFLLVEITISSNPTVDYYVNLITTMEQRARTFQPPTDARRYSASNELKDFGQYDYIIIGAGTAGSVVANRLSENPQWNILVLEAGSFENDFVDIPGMVYQSGFTEYNWGYSSVPQNTSCLGMIRRSCPFPAGNGVGGTTLINGLVYSRGNAHDFDKWAAEGNSGWSYKDLLPYFKKAEHTTIPDEDVGYHGHNGPLNNEYRKPPSPYLYAFLEANLELGRRVVDYNGKYQVGVSAAQQNMLKGRRHTNGNAYIKSVLHRNNLKVMTKSYVTKILIDKQKIAYAVEFTNKGNRFIVKAKHEVILSAGAINSPRILMLSGVGPKKHLEEYKIPVIKNLAVGDHLIDHPSFRGIVFETNYMTPIKSLRNYVEDYLKGLGTLTMTSNFQGLGFLQTPLAEYPDVPDIEILVFVANATSEFEKRANLFTNESYDVLWGNSEVTRSINLPVAVMHSISEGTIRLKSKDPFDYPLIDSRFLSDPLNKDIDTIYAGVQIVLEMINTEAFKKLNTVLSIKPHPGCKEHKFLSKDYWYCYIRQVTISEYHPAGTCKMGPDPYKGAVVDRHLKVYGIKNLRVADASIFPAHIAAHPAATITVIGEVLSDFIKKERKSDDYNFFSENYF